MPTTPATIEPSERRVVLARRLEKSLVAPKTQTRNGKLVAVRGYTDKRTRQTPLYATKTRTARGNVVYEYDEKQTAESTAQKFGRVAVLAQNLPEIIGDTDRALDKPDTPLEKVVGAVIALMDRCQFRIGTESMAEEHGTFGVTTLRTEHVTVSGDEIRFTFPGKKQVAWDRAIVDSRLARLVTTLKAESPDGRLFWYHGPTGESKPLKATQVNTVLNGYGVTAKDFRTYHGTRLAWEELRHFSRKASSPALSPKEIKSRIAQTVSAVAEKLGNTPAVAKGNYILPQLLKDFAVNGGRLSTTNPWRTAERMSKSVFVEEKRGCITLTQSDRDFAAYLKCLDQGEHLEKSLVKPKTQVRGGKTVLVRGYSDKRTRKPEEAAVPRAQAQPKDTGERIVSIPVAQIRPDPEQHRKTFNAAHLRELADSMKESGQKTPIVIRPITDGGKVKYQIIAGERRWRAAHLVGLKSLKATVREGVTQEQALTEQVIENLNREQVTPMEEAVAYGQLAKLFIAKAKRSKEWQGKDPAKLAEASRRYVAQQTGKQQHHVAFYLKLNDLEDEVQEMVSHGSLTPRHGNMLTRLTDGVDDPKELRERKAHQVRMARYARAHSIAADALGAMITAYLGERQQTSMFGGDEAVSGDKLEARREAKAKIDKIVSAVADAIAETFSEGKQEFRVGALGGGELVANLAKIRGAIKTLDQVAAIMEEEVARRDVGEATKRRVDSGGSGPGTHGTSLSAQASMFKSIVHAYTRRLKSGKTVQVREHQDRRGKKQITAKAKPQPHADEPMATRDAVDPMQPWKGGVPSAAASPGRLMWTAREGGTSGKPAGPVSITKPWMVLPEAIPTDEEMSDVEWQGRQGTANADMPSPHSSYLDLPVGSWRIDPVLGHMEELRSVRVDRLEPGEEVGSRFAWGDKYKYLAPYAEWLRQGHKPYPAVAVETPTGKIRLINGHRRWLAAIQAGYTHMEVWVSPAETPGASVGLSHRVMVEQALAAGKPVPPDVVARYSSMEKALFTRKHLEDLEKQGHPHGLFLLRHCEAGPHAGIDDDPTRPLTEKGERQAQRAAQWFKRQPGIRAVFASPLTRTQETAKPVAAALGLKVQTEAALAPGKLTVGTIRRLVASVKGQGSIVVVSHEPDLSSLLKQLTGDENKFSRGEVRQVEWNDLRAERGSVVGAVKNREMKDPETVPMEKALHENANSVWVGTLLPPGAAKRLGASEEYADDLHMTLLFILEGPTTSKGREKVLDIIREGCGLHCPMKCQITGTGIVGAGPYVEAGLVTVANGAALHANLVALLAMGWRKFKRTYDFLPHVTLRDVPEGAVPGAMVALPKPYTWTAREAVVEFGHNGKRVTVPLLGQVDDHPVEMRKAIVFVRMESRQPMHPAIASAMGAYWHEKLEKSLGGIRSAIARRLAASDSVRVSCGQSGALNGGAHSDRCGATRTASGNGGVLFGAQEYVRHGTGARHGRRTGAVAMHKALIVPNRNKYNLRELIAALRTRLAREEETIGAYEADAARSPKPQVAAQLRGIAEEERVHVGELLRIIEALAKKEKALVAKGEGEVGADVRKRRAVLAQGMEKSYVKPHISHTADGKPYHVAGHVDKRTKKAEQKAEQPNPGLLPYAERIAHNLKQMGTQMADWHAVPIFKVSVDQETGRSMPTFDFPRGYGAAPSFYGSGEGCCHLCGHNIKNYFWIQNDEHKWTMAVGSECIGLFDEGQSGIQKVHAKQGEQQLDEWREQLRSAEHTRKALLEYGGHYVMRRDGVMSQQVSRSDGEAYELAEKLSSLRTDIEMPGMEDTNYLQSHVMRRDGGPKHEADSIPRIRAWFKKHGVELAGTLDRAHQLAPTLIERERNPIEEAFRAWATDEVRMVKNNHSYVREVGLGAALNAVHTLALSGTVPLTVDDWGSLRKAAAASDKPTNEILQYLLAARDATKEAGGAQTTA